MGYSGVAPGICAPAPAIQQSDRSLHRPRRCRRVACRWLVPGVSFGRGLLTGLVVGFAGVVLRVVSLLEDITVLLVAEAVLVATFLACKRGVDHSRKKQTDQSPDMSQQPW